MRDRFLAAAAIALAVAAPAPAADPPAVAFEARLINYSGGSLPFGRFGFPPASGRPTPLTDEQVKLLFDYLEGDRRATVTRATAAEDRVPRGATGQVLIPGPTWVREDRIDEEYGGPLLEPFPALARQFTVPVVYRSQVRTYLVVTVPPAVPVAPPPRAGGRR